MAGDVINFADWAAVAVASIALFFSYRASRSAQGAYEVALLEQKLEVYKEFIDQGNILNSMLVYEEKLKGLDRIIRLSEFYYEAETLKSLKNYQHALLEFKRLSFREITSANGESFLRKIHLKKSSREIESDSWRKECGDWYQKSKDLMHYDLQQFGKIKPWKVAKFIKEISGCNEAAVAAHIAKMVKNDSSEK